MCGLQGTLKLKQAVCFYLSISLVTIQVGTFNHNNKLLHSAPNSFSSATIVQKSWIYDIWALNNRYDTVWAWESFILPIPKVCIWVLTLPCLAYNDFAMAYNDFAMSGL